MWVDQLENDGALKLIGDTFTFEELWEAAVELDQQFAARQVTDKHIPKNQDKGEQKDRVKILGVAVLAGLLEHKI